MAVECRRIENIGHTEVGEFDDKGFELVIWSNRKGNSQRTKIKIGWWMLSFLAGDLRKARDEYARRTAQELEHMNRNLVQTPKPEARS